jgi:CDP-6-deoxy-D-xylo-4-hexulose-3-dehydrase
MEELLILPKAEQNSEPSWFGFPLSLKKNTKYKRNDLIKYLNQYKIGTRLLFSGNLIKQPFMKGVKFRVNKDLKNTDFVLENTFWIGVYPGLRTEHFDFIIQKIKDFFSN